LEIFLWKHPESANKDKLREELADIIAFCLLLAEKEGLDVREILLEKIASNAEKYPVEKAKGTAKKYNEL
jgi:NTP pyrophosphatase (non-canonical NTP hydrolase)